LIFVDKSASLVDNLTTPYFPDSYATTTDAEAVGYAQASSAAHIVARF
jgi:hypothetical protein